MHARQCHRKDVDRPSVNVLLEPRRTKQGIGRLLSAKDLLNAETAIVWWYGVIFTCLSSRAVHLEVASSLDSDVSVYCISALRRFIRQRGHVSSMHSYNGIHFMGAAKELR